MTTILDKIVATKRQEIARAKQARPESELRAELSEFSHDGLIQLREDLARRAVVRGSWAGCVISYKRGVITIVDRKGLEQASCSCYASDRATYERFFG